jgi:hypothetical protein
VLRTARKRAPSACLTQCSHGSNIKRKRIDVVYRINKVRSGM